MADIEDNNDPINERRRAPRVKGAVVEYYHEGGEAFKKKAFIKDVSIGGLCIYVLEPIDPTTVLGVDIYLLGSDEPVRATAAVVWRHKDEVSGYDNLGMEFSEISEEDKKKLSDYIAQYK